MQKFSSDFLAYTYIAIFIIHNTMQQEYKKISHKMIELQVNRSSDNLQDVESFQIF